MWDTVTRFQMTGIGWPLPPAMSEKELERRLYRKQGSLEANPERVPDWAEVQRELRNKHVTLRLLWEETRKPTRGIEPRTCSLRVSCSAS